MTPHHSTGARFVAQSNVKRLISHMTTSTGIGASNTSVLLRKGKAKISWSVNPNCNPYQTAPTIVAEEGDDKIWVLVSVVSRR